MENLNILIPFALIASFTPGPNNILVMSQGINYGFKNTIPYQIGAGLSCFIIIFSVTLLGTELDKYLPSMLHYLRYFGCAYMLWLAFGVLRSRPEFGNEHKKSASLWSGFILQFINPKYYLYVLTLASVMIIYKEDIFLILRWSVFFTTIAVAGMLAWAIFGSVLQNFLRKHYRLVNSSMAMALAWCAYSLI